MRNSIKIIILLCFIFLSIKYNYASSIDSSSESVLIIDDNEIYDRAEVMPSFPGGKDGIIKFLGKNIKYPKHARENGIEGKVVVKFYIDKDGNIKNPLVLNDVDESLKKEALRVINLMPKWLPALQGGKPVNCYFTLPVTFKLA